MNSLNRKTFYTFLRTSKIVLLCLSLTGMGAFGRTASSKKATKERKPSCSKICQQAFDVRSRIEELIKKQNLTGESLAKMKYNPDVPGQKLAEKELAQIIKSVQSLVTEDDLDAILIVWSAAVDFDPGHAIALNNLDLLTPLFNRLRAHIHLRMRDPKNPVTKKNLEGILFALAIAESEVEGIGNDPDHKVLESEM
ncbi:MAG: hypothetical protein IPJ71_03980 [Bdellovibrionales bacterium]|nr:hypothetical protein [Bdellovibrionales bacterium]